MEFYGSLDQKGEDTPQVLIIPQFTPSSDLSGLALLLTHGLGTDEGPLKDLPTVIEPCCTDCRCKAHLDRFRTGLARFGILASDVMRILSSLVLLHSLSFTAEPHRIRGRSEANVNAGVRVAGPELLAALGRCLGVEAKVLEAGLLWDVSGHKQVNADLRNAGNDVLRFFQKNY
jgi:hypothetical protein